MVRRRQIRFCSLIATVLVGLLSPTFTFAAESAMDLTNYWAGILALAVFIVAYVLVIGEETIHLRKSKPVIVAAGVIWVLVAIAYTAHGDTHSAAVLVRHNLLEFAEP